MLVTRFVARKFNGEWYVFDRKNKCFVSGSYASEDAALNACMTHY